MGTRPRRFVVALALVALALPSAAAQAAPPPLSFWRLDETSVSQPAADDQGHHPGSYAGTPQLGIAGVSSGGTAMKITDASMTVPSSTDFDYGSNFSFEIWVKPPGPAGTYGSYRAIACNTNYPSQGWLLATDLNGGLIFQAGDGGGSLSYAKTTTSLTNGVWNQVVAVVDQGTKRLYLNGVQVATGGGTGNPTTMPLQIGNCNPNGGLRAGIGFSFDQAAIYRRALSPSEIQAHNANPEAVASANPLSFWRLDESSTSQAAADAQGRHPGSYAGTPQLAVAGTSGTGMKITDQSMTVPSSTDFDYSANFSFEIWVKPPGAAGTYGSYRAIACNTNYPSQGWLLATAVGGGLIFQAGDGGGSLSYAKTTTSLTSGTWNQVVAVVEQGTKRLYLNGVQVATGGGTGNPTTKPLQIGNCNPNGGLNPGTGFSYDQAAIYQRALSASEVASHYNSPLQGPPRNTAPPVVAGLANDGEVLSTSPGGWSPDPETEDFQWQRCDASGGSCVDLFGQTTAQYHVTSTDVGATLRVRATASNSIGSGVAYSAAVPVLGPVQTVATDFRPGLFFDTGEHWRPLDVPDFLSETFPDGGQHKLCYVENGDPKCPPQAPPGEGDFVAPYTKLDINGNRGDASSFYSPWTCDKPEGSFDCDGDSHSAIYFEPTRDAALGYLYLDYWIFYRYNDSPDVTGDHEGDWEGMTVVLDPTGPPSNTGPPVAAYALYAAHDGKTWSAYLGDPAVPHIAGFVGRGTHSTNPEACSSDCPSHEWTFDGNVPWAFDASGGPEPGLVACDGCVIRFPDQPWVSWDGFWGTSDEGALPGGGSPPSPGQQSRFKCAQSFYSGDCPTPPFAGQPALRLLHVGGASRRVGGPAAAASSCGAWEGEAAAVAVCQPARLRASIVHRRLDEHVRPNLRLPGFKGRIAAVDGITQAIGQPLQSGRRILVRGSLAAGSEIVLRVENHARRWVARFRIPRLEPNQRAWIGIARGTVRPDISLRLPHRILRPDLLRLEPR